MKVLKCCGVISGMRSALHLLVLPVCLSLCLINNAFAQDPRNYHPDLTNGDDQYADPTKPGDYKHNDEWTWNLGPTGMSGWMYRYDWFQKYAGWSTDLARQIEVQIIDPGSPAEGIMQIGDVILGADGTGADPVAFTWDARKALADAIGEAEARSPAELKLLVWRAGVTSIETLTLETLGAYSATAPYNCPKSAAILEKGLDAVMAVGASDTTKFNLVTLLAGNDPSNPDNAARMARVQQEIQELILTPPEVDYFMSNQFLIDNAGNRMAWSHGFKLVALAEYYLQTGDSAAFDSVRAYAVAAANGQSMFGTSGHQFCVPAEDGSLNGPYGIGYGIVNSANMQCFYGMLLAREAGITDQRVLDAIERASNFYGGYVDRGGIPYGEHTPGNDHGENGKNGIAALCYKLQGGHNNFANYYSMMAGASATNIDAGHQGPYLNYLWASMGANAGGEESMAAFFEEQRWFYELARDHDGTFTYNSYQNGGQLGYEGDKWSSLQLQMYTACLLPYAAPLRQTYVTGKNTTDNPSDWLTTQELGDVDLAVNYDATIRTTNELLDDLGSVHPFTRNDAAAELGLRTSEHATILPTLESLAADTNASLHERMGACAALGAIANDNSLSLLIGLLSDPEDLVKFAAAKAIPNFSSEAKLAEVDAVMTACATEAKPLLPMDVDDPLHLTHGAIIDILFGGYAGGILRSHDLVGIDRDLFYPAISAAVSHPQGRTRSWATDVYSNLTKEDVEALADVIIPVAWDEAPADRMFSGAVQVDSVEVLHKYGFSEGVPLAQETIAKETRDHKFIYDALALYEASALSVIPDPKTIEFCELKVASNDEATRAQAVLDAIAADLNPDVVVPLKGIHMIEADDASLTLPADRTTLRAYAYNHVGAELYYTWRKLHGAGEVTFVRNGSNAAASTEVVFDGVPGEYLFEVTISDFWGLTEVSDTVAVTLNDTGGSLPTNDPPTANDQPLVVDAGTPTQIILTGSDPEGNALTYMVISGPTNGQLTGTAPNLVYTAYADYSGADTITFEVMDSEGQIDSASVNITVGTGAPVGLAIYEPFDYVVGTLDGSSGATEIGLDGSWVTSHPYHFLDGPTLTFGTLPTTGLRAYGLGGDSFGRTKANAARPISVDALVSRGLMDDGATVWFSIIMGNIGSTNNMGVDLALANGTLEKSGGYVEEYGVDPGTGIGVKLQGTIAQAAQFYDSSTSALMGSWDESAAGLFKVDEQRLVVGKITWGAASDTIEIYLPYDDMVLPSVPSSTLVANVDQSKFDTLTFASAYWAGTTYLDEIRFGATLQSVLQGTADMTADTAAPTPDPMTFSVAPTPSGGSSITMVATPAHDAMEVEYYFTCTAGGGNDSGWQDGNVYTDTSLTPGVQYSYTVKARDKYPALNETASSSVASATIPTQGILPDVIGMAQTAAESAITDAGMAVGNVTQSGSYSLTVPAGHVLSQSPTGPASTGYGTSVDLVISIGQDPALPTLTSLGITDDTLGLPVNTNETITYTLNFSENMNVSSIDAGDFVNLISYPMSIGAISQPSPGVVTVEVTGTGSTSGSILLAIAQGAVITDAQGDTLNTLSLIADDTVISVIDSGDATPPTLASSDIVDDQGGADVTPSTLVTYTVIFSEDMDAATVTSADFSNAGSSSITIGSVVETSPGVFTVEATPTSGGTLQLQVSASADLTDAAGNALVTSSAIADDTVINVVLPGDTTPPNPDPMSFAVLPTADLGGGGGAGGMSASLTTPATDGADISSFGTSSGGNSIWTDRSARGQTFTTGAEAVDLNAVTVLMTNGPATKTFVVRVSTVSGTNLTEVYSETFTQTFAVGTSEYVTFNFTTPVALVANTEYAFDVGMTSSTTGWSSGMPNISYTSDLYAGGQHYKSGSGGAGTSTLSLETGDLNFHLDMSTGGGGGSLSEDSITMTATTATDSSGVEYYFTETSGNPGGSDSGWQSSPVYTDTGLQAGTQYTYTVTARDLSANQNATAPSAPASATTGGTTPVPDAVIYENFDYEAGNIAGDGGDGPGATPPASAGSSVGLSGTWGGDSRLSVTSGSLSYGSLQTSGNSAQYVGTGGGGGNLGINISGDLAAAGLLDDEADLWFSIVVNFVDVGNDEIAFALGTAEPYVNNLQGGNGIGFYTNSSGNTQAALYNAGALATSTGIANFQGTTQIIVGHVAWGTDGSTADTLTLYAPGTDLDITGHDFSTVSADITQSGLSRIGFWFRNGDSDTVDEIRFGGSLIDVMPSGSGGGDTTPPSLAGSDIVDDQGGANVTENDLVTYTVTFSEDMDEATVDSADFSNAGSSSVTIGTITEISPGVFTVQATPTNAGTLQLQVSASAVLTDVAGNALDTASAILDDTTITVDQPTTTVPNVVGLAQATAEADIVAANLIVGTINNQYDAVVPAGDVISQSPTGGNTVTVDTAVDLVVSLGPPQTTVPNVVGLAQATAESDIVAANLVVGNVTSQYDAVVPVGSVISQSPTGGNTVDEGTAVDLVVSLGPPQTTVPNVVGLAQATAEANIVAANLLVGTVTTQNDPVVPAGDVISQNPTGGSTVNEGSSVDLVVSDGPTQTTVPSVVGLAQATAEANIVAANLLVGTVTTQNDPVVPAGDVISQNPTGGSTVDEGSSVDLVVSDGPTQTTVPNVVGLAQATAESNIVAANLVVGTVTTQNDPVVPAGDVISQNPAGGTTADEGSSVDLVVSDGPPQTTVPNVIGLAQATAESNIVAATLVIGTVTTQYSETVADGDVISQNPSGGVSVDEGSSVDLVVSDGPNPSAASALIVESFEDSDATLDGNAVGTGLSGTWSSNSASVVAGSVSYGSLPVSGNKAQVGASSASVSTGGTLSGYVDDGDTLWFSVAVHTGTDIGTNPDIGFALGTNGIANTNNLPMSDAGDGGLGLGFTIKQGQVRATWWDPNDGNGTALDRTTNNSGNGVSASTSYLVVGELICGATDTLNIYLPDTALNRGSVVSTTTVSFDQTLFDTISFAAKASGAPHTFDEIRVGETFDSVIGGTVQPDTTPPTLVGSDIVDDQGGANVTENDLVTYTVTFSEDIDGSTVDATDFSNAGSSSVTIGTITETSPGVFTVEATPTNAGTLQLQVSAGAAITDVAGNALNTASAIADDTTIIVDLPTTTVPDVVGLAQAAAEANIVAANLTVGSITTQTDAVVPAGDVISQSPTGGNTATVGSAVDLVVSLGPPQTTVPNVVGLAQATAESNITAANLVVGNVTGQYDAGVPAGDVISQTPTGGSAVDEGTSVDLVVSLGPPLTTVPNVVGQAQAAAESNIVAANLIVGTITQANSETVPAGDVISQGLTAGSSVPEGSAVDLVISLGPAATVNLVRTTVAGVSNTSWTTVNLGQTYTSPIIVATPIHPTGVTTPVVTRITNITSTGFDLKLDRADGLSGAVSYDVSVIAVEEGVYTQAADGVTMEAVKFTSTYTSGKSNWVGEARTYQNSYTSPTVVGQVMSYNDTNWSTFWSMGSGSKNPIDASSLNVGKHIGEDGNSTRADETIGYIVIESGNGTIDGVAYEAAMGGDSVKGFDDSSTPFNYTLSGSLSSVSAAALSQSAMDGNDGSWAVLYGASPLSPTNIDLYVSEDQINDSEQRHVNEQVGYIVFE